MKSISSEVRYAIFDYLWNKGVRSRELGYSPTILNKVKNRRLPVSTPMLAKMLRYLSLEEFAKLVAGERPEPKPSLSEPRDLSEAVLQVKSMVKALGEVVKRFPQLSSLIYQEVMDLVKTSLKGYSIQVTEDHVAKFEKLLKDRSPKTTKNHLNYLRRALRDLNYELSADRLQEYILELRENSVNVARHASKALKLFIKLVLKDSNLYQAFKVVKVEASVKDVPSLEEVKAVARTIEWPPAKAYYCLLAETGLRPGEVLNARLSDLNLDERVLRIGKVTNTKRSYQAFFSERLKEYLAEVYLPYRDAFVKRYEVNVRNLLREATEGWRELLFPFKDSTLRASIYDAMDKALGRRFRLYDLRAFFASYMSLRGVPGQVIDILQGRVPPREFRVLTQHYLAFSLEDLRRIYDQAELRVLD